MYQGHFLGHMVRQLRQMRLAGASSRDLMAHLQPYFPDTRAMAVRYLNYTFLGAGLRLVGVLRMGKWEDFGAADPIWPMADALIDGAKDEWSGAPVPELMRIRDYVAFLEFTREQRVIATVRAAHPSAGQWVGRAGARCYAGRLCVPSLATGPHAGLLAADPADPALQATLAAYGGLAYRDYLDSLAADGYRVLTADAGFALVDRDGRRQYDGYRLHGVHDAQTNQPVWTGRRGEQLRSALNRCLGEELVRFGPHDEWEHRNDQRLAGPLWGPQVPAIEFTAGERIRNILSTKELAQGAPYESRWSELYPHHPSGGGA